MSGGQSIVEADEDGPRAEAVAAHLDVILFALDELRALQAEERKRHETTWGWQAETIAGIERMIAEVQRRVRECG
ncbi:hypothetical protein L6Q96_20130 [Candidatus Binatia bacterium]|nr:hypothetical protein [Candidatus Binatia bacterium]